MKMFITKKTTLLLIVLVLSSFGCIKDKNELIVADAVVKNTGDPAADGCGWLLFIGSNTMSYKPENLPFEYRVDDLHIHITYKLLNTKYQCGQIPPTSNSGIPNIHINSISK